MSVVNALVEIFQESGFLSLEWQNWVMIVVSFLLLYFAIVKKYEPLLLLPIAFGMLLVNIYPEIMADPLMLSSYEGVKDPTAHWYDTGVLRLIYSGVKSSIFPCLIFLAIGAMTDFGPLLANPISLLLGAAAQLGIYVAFMIAILCGHVPFFAGIYPRRSGFYRHHRRSGRPHVNLADITVSPAVIRTDCRCSIFLYGVDSVNSAADYACNDHQKRARNQNEPVAHG